MGMYELGLEIIGRRKGKGGGGRNGQHYTLMLACIKGKKERENSGAFTQ